MKIGRRLTPGLVFCLMALAGCNSESVITDDPNMPPLSSGKIQAARQLVEQALVHDSKGKRVGWVGGGLYRTAIARASVANDILSITVANDQHSTFSCPLNSLGPIRISSDPAGRFIELMCGDGGAQISFWHDSKDTVQHIANALLTLEHAAKFPLSPDQDPEFQKVVADYRSAPAKFVLPETVRMYSVQAEDAIKSKQFNDAAKLYEQALEVAPWWPQGHYNRALIMGEMKDFPHAIVEMQRYLALVPEAPNARALQDQIYVWERREKDGAPGAAQ